MADGLFPTSQLAEIEELQVTFLWTQFCCSLQKLYNTCVHIDEEKSIGKFSKEISEYYLSKSP